MGYRAFKTRSARTQIALIVTPGIALVIAGLVGLGGTIIGIGALLVILGLVVWPLLDADGASD